MRLTTGLLLCAVACAWYTGGSPVRAEPAARGEFRHLRLGPLPEGTALLTASVETGDGVRAKLDSAQRERLGAIVRELAKGRAAEKRAIEAEWRRLIESMRGGQTPLDLTELIRSVVREAYLDRNPRARAAALRLRGLEADEGRVRARLRQAQTEAKRPGLSPEAAARLAEEIKRLEDELRGLGDAA